MNDPEDIFTVGPGMTLLEAYTKAIARVAELEAAIVTLRAAHTNVIQTPVKNASSISRMALAETDGILKP